MARHVFEEEEKRGRGEEKKRRHSAMLTAVKSSAL